MIGIECMFLIVLIVFGLLGCFVVFLEMEERNRHHLRVTAEDGKGAVRFGIIILEKRIAHGPVAFLWIADWASENDQILLDEQVHQAACRDGELDVAELDQRFHHN